MSRYKTSDVLTTMICLCLEIKKKMRTLEGPPLLAIGIFHGALFLQLLVWDCWHVCSFTLWAQILPIACSKFHTLYVGDKNQKNRVLNETRLHGAMYAFLIMAIAELHGRVIYAASCMGRRGNALQTAVRQMYLIRSSKLTCVKIWNPGSEGLRWPD